MGNKEEWEELEKWQKEYEAKKEKEMKVDIKQFKSKDTKKAKKISLMFNFVSKSTITIFAILFVIVAVAAVLWVYGQVSIYIPKDTIKELENIYKGEKFEIIEDYSTISEHGVKKGAYIVSPQDNKDIKFKVYNKGTQLHNDYIEQKTRYYIENCQEKELLEGFEITEGTENYEVYGNTEFLKYNITMEIINYNEIEEKVEKVCRLANYLKNQDDKIYQNIELRNNDINYWIPFSCNQGHILKDEIKNAKYYYINALKNAKASSQLKEIGEEEIYKTWKPQSLLLFINEKQAKLYNNFDAKVYYDNIKGYYYMSGLDPIFKQIEEVKILKEGIFSGSVKKIQYKDKIYKVSGSSYDGKNNENIIYSNEKIEDFCKKFNTEPKYDYGEEKVYIIIE